SQVATTNFGRSGTRAIPHSAPGGRMSAGGWPKIAFDRFERNGRLEALGIYSAGAICERGDHRNLGRTPLFAPPRLSAKVDSRASDAAGRRRQKRQPAKQ